MTVRVLNILTAPVASSDIDINVYVRAAENLELANPTELDVTNRLSVFAPQSAEFSERVVSDAMEMGNTKAPPEHQYQVHYGENIRSFRTLLHRYELVSIDQVPVTNTPNLLQYFVKYFYKMPPSPGYAPSGLSTAGKIVGVGLAPYNYASLTLLSYLAPAYLCYRGSVNWSFNVSPDVPLRNLRVVKDNQSGSLAGTAVFTSPASSQNAVAWTITKRYSGLSGQALTNQITQAGISVQCPMFTQFKFQSTAPNNANQGVAVDGSILDLFILEGDYQQTVTGGTANNTNIYSYAAAGHDFSLHFFLNVPTFYVYSVIPPPL
jgi:hypothetical protein